MLRPSVGVGIARPDLGSILGSTQGIVVIYSPG
jgi:hypothetical protein